MNLIAIERDTNTVLVDFTTADRSVAPLIAAGLYREKDNMIAKNAPANLSVNDLSYRAIVNAVVAILELAGDAQNQDEARLLIKKATNLVRPWKESSTNVSFAPLRGGLAPWQLSQVESFIDKNLNQVIKIGDLARVAGLGYSYFFQAFRCSVGVSPHTYIIQRRIELAQRLILLTNHSLSYIALECGLTDQPHLTRLFRTVVGVSPGVWRRTHVAKSSD